MKGVFLLSVFKNQGTEKLNNLPRITEPRKWQHAIRNRARHRLQCGADKQRMKYTDLRWEAEDSYFSLISKDYKKDKEIKKAQL